MLLQAYQKQIHTGFNELSEDMKKPSDKLYHYQYWVVV